MIQIQDAKVYVQNVEISGLWTRLNIILLMEYVRTVDTQNRAKKYIKVIVYNFENNGLSTVLLLIICNKHDFACSYMIGELM